MRGFQKIRSASTVSTKGTMTKRIKRSLKTVVLMLVWAPSKMELLKMRCFCRTFKTRWSWSRGSSETKRLRRGIRRRQCVICASGRGLSLWWRLMIWSKDYLSGSCHRSWEVWRRTSTTRDNIWSFFESVWSMSRHATVRWSTLISIAWPHRL